MLFGNICIIKNNNVIFDTSIPLYVPHNSFLLFWHVFLFRALFPVCIVIVVVPDTDTAWGWYDLMKRRTVPHQEVQFNVRCLYWIFKHACSQGYCPVLACFVNEETYHWIEKSSRKQFHLHNIFVLYISWHRDCRLHLYHVLSVV